MKVLPAINASMLSSGSDANLMFLLFLCWCCNLLMQGLRDAARVKWEKDGISNTYRVGYEGKVSLSSSIICTLPNFDCY